MKSLPLTEQAHQHLKPRIKPGDVLIDATAGNGYDTLFLAQQTGSAGRVFAFDPQAVAIEKTQDRLEENRAQKQCVLVQAGHENMEGEIPSHYHGSVKAITFNLGYLPGAEKEFTTRAQTTVMALDQSLKLLSPQGIISLLIYKGHPAGKEEYIEIKKWLKQHPDLHQKIYLSVDPDDYSPELWQLTQKTIR